MQSRTVRCRLKNLTKFETEGAFDFIGRDNGRDARQNRERKSELPNRM